MKQLFLFGCLLLCLSLPACQCSDKPEMAPVEGASAETVVKIANVLA